MGILWVKQCHVYHPPVITIFMGGINHSQMVCLCHFVYPHYIDESWVNNPSG